MIKRIKIKELLVSKSIGNIVNVKGWVRTKRGNKNVAFIALNDGSIIHTIQIVVDVIECCDCSDGVLNACNLVRILWITVSEG